MYSTATKIIKYVHGAEEANRSILINSMLNLDEVLNK